jgi:hypothetical protein
MPPDAPRQTRAQRFARSSENRDRIRRVVPRDASRGPREQSQLRQLLESDVVATVRRRCQQEEPPCAPREVVTQVITIRLAADAVRFVDDDEIPGIGRQAVANMWLLQEID